MRRTVAVCCLAACLVLAGCGGSNGTATPGSSPAPGIEGGQLTNATALLEAHQSTLADEEFVTVMTREGALPQTVQVNGSRQTKLLETTLNQTVVTEAAFAPYVYTLRTDVNGSVSQTDAWGNESVQYTRLQVGSQQRIQLGQPQSPASITSRSFLETHFRTGDYTVSESGADGRVTLQASGLVDDPELTPGGGTVTDYEGTIVVDSQGRVQSLEASYTYELGGETASVDVTFDLQQAGDVSVQRPGWVPE